MFSTNNVICFVCFQIEFRKKQFKKLYTNYSDSHFCQSFACHKDLPLITYLLRVFLQGISSLVNHIFVAYCSDQYLLTLPCYFLKRFFRNILIVLQNNILLMENNIIMKNNFIFLQRMVYESTFKGFQKYQNHQLVLIQWRIYCYFKNCIKSY